MSTLNTDPLRTEFRLSKSGILINLILLLVCGAIFGVIGVVMISNAKPIPGLAFLLIGFGIAFLGYWLRRRALSDPRPKLMVDSVGIFAPGVAGKVIPCGDISKVVFVRSRPKKPPYLSIDVDDFERYEPTRSTRMLARANQALGGGEFVVQTSNLDAPMEEIRAAMQKAHQSLVILDR